MIQKSDKGSSITIIEKRGHLEKRRNVLSDSAKFRQLFVAEDKQWNFIVNVEKHIADLLKDLKNSEVISEIVYKSLEPRGCGFGILYGLCKFYYFIIYYYYLYLQLVQRSKKLIKTNYPVNAIYGFHVKNCIKC